MFKGDKIWPRVNQNQNCGAWLSAALFRPLQYSPLAELTTGQCKRNIYMSYHSKWTVCVISVSVLLSVLPVIIPDLQLTNWALALWSSESDFVCHSKFITWFYYHYYINKIQVISLEQYGQFSSDIAAIRVNHFLITQLTVIFFSCKIQ